MVRIALIQYFAGVKTFVSKKSVSANYKNIHGNANTKSPLFLQTCIFMFKAGYKYFMFKAGCKQAII